MYSIKEENMRRLADYQRQLWLNPKLTFLFFELTDQCNLGCRHCGSSCSGGNHAYLPFETVKKVLKRVADRYNPRQIMVCLTGGEPLLHPRCADVVRLSSELGFPVGITSNGTLIGDQTASALADAGLNTISISVDGIGETHDQFRNSKGCFERAIAGIKALQANGIEPQIMSVIHKQNLNQLEEMFSFFQSLDVYSWRLTNVDPIGRAREENELLLDGNDLKRLYDFIQRARMDGGGDMEVTYGCSHFVTLAYERMIRDSYFQCGAGTQVASITAQGEIVACLDIERRADLVQGTVWDDDFIDVWENKFQTFRRDRTEDSDICRNCEKRGICLGDATHTWDFDHKRPNYCVSKMMEGQK